jgi:hypothetical protein
MQLLIYATATAGIAVSNPPAWLQERFAEIFDTFPDASSALKAMAAQGGTLNPFTPDLIGEFLVLTLLQEYFPFNTDVEQFIRHAWNDNPEYLSDFLMRVKIDFGEEEKIISIGWLKKMLAGPLTDSEPSFRVYYGLLSAMKLFHHKPLILSQGDCANKMHEIHKRYQRDEYVIEHMKNLWYMCQMFNVGAATLIWVIEQIDSLLEFVPEKYEVIYTCAQILHDISIVQSRRLDVYDEINNGITENISELLCGQYDENGKIVKTLNAEPTLEDAQVLGKTTGSLYSIVNLVANLQRDNADTAIMYACSAYNSLRVLSDEQNEMIFGMVKTLARKHDSLTIWKYYLAGLVYSALTSGDHGRANETVRQIQDVSTQNTDNNELVTQCSLCIEQIEISV